MANTKKKTNPKKTTNNKHHTGPRHNPGATSALCLRSKHVMTLYADNKCKDGGTAVANTKTETKITRKACTKPCHHLLPIIRRTFMTTQKVLS